MILKYRLILCTLITLFQCVTTQASRTSNSEQKLGSLNQELLKLTVREACLYERLIKLNSLTTPSTHPFIAHQITKELDLNSYKQKFAKQKIQRIEQESILAEANHAPANSPIKQESILAATNLLPENSHNPSAIQEPDFISHQQKSTKQKIQSIEQESILAAANRAPKNPSKSPGFFARLASWILRKSK